MSTCVCWSGEHNNAHACGMLMRHRRNANTHGGVDRCGMLFVVFCFSLAFV